MPLLFWVTARDVCQLISHIARGGAMVLAAKTETKVEEPISRLLWVPPQLVKLLSAATSNNSSGDGDGDAAYAHS